MDYADVLNALDSINERFKEIPHGNSDFQEKNFVIAQGITPERSYRKICLQLQSNLHSLRTAYFDKKRKEIEIKQLKNKAENPSDSFEREISLIDCEEKSWQLKDVELKIHQLTHTVTLLTGYLEQFPRYTREQFEAAETKYYLAHLTNQINGVTGAKLALQSMNEGVDSIIAQIEAPEQPKQIGDGE